MWSVKNRPNPGSARIASRSASASTCGDRSRVKLTDMDALRTFGGPTVVVVRHQYQVSAGPVSRHRCQFPSAANRTYLLHSPNNRFI